MKASHWKPNFEHREVKSHFINPCCFGEDFAAWLKEQLSCEFWLRLFGDYPGGLRLGFWARHGKESVLGGPAYVGDGPEEGPAQWGVSINYDPGLNLLKRIFHEPDREALKLLLNRVRQTLTSNSAIRMVSTPQCAS
jgi:hypothetical protein